MKRSHKSHQVDSPNARSSRLRLLQAWLVLPIAIVLGMLAFADVGASAPQAPAAPAGPSQHIRVPRSHTAGHGAAAAGAGTSSTQSVKTVVVVVTYSDPRFDVAANPTGTQYCPHSNHPPPCGKHPHGVEGVTESRGGKGSQYVSGTSVTRTTTTSTMTPGAETEQTVPETQQASTLPFTGQSVLLVLLIGLVLTEVGLELAGRSHEQRSD